MSDNKSQSSGQPGLLTMNIPDREALYAAYMPFMRHGGLFVPTTSEFELGDEVLLLLTFEKQRYSISGKVAWINPKGAQNRRRQGVGVQFGADAAEVQRQFDAALAGMMGTERPTETM